MPVATRTAAAKPAPPAAPPSPPPGALADPLADPLAGGGAVVVAKGDTLYGLAKRHVGDGNRWPELHKANKATVPDPARLAPGMRLSLPASWARVTQPKPPTTPPAAAPPAAKPTPAAGPAANQKPADDTQPPPRVVAADAVERVLAARDPASRKLLDTLLRQDAKRAADLRRLPGSAGAAASTSAAKEPEVAASPAQTAPPATSDVVEPATRNLLYEAALDFATKNPQRLSGGDATSWNGWCASLMFRFGKATSGFKDGKNDAPNAIGASKRSKIESTDHKSAKKGAFHWWDIGVHGHVGLDLSGGGREVFMATKKLQQAFGDKANAIGTTSVPAYTKAISGGKYLGWSMDYVGGTIDPELLKAPPA
jgi:hypothetical protein